MIALFKRTVFQALLVAAFAIPLLVHSTPSFAWSSETKNKCTGDAFRLCATSIGDDAATEACMQKKSASLSAGCKSAVEKERGGAQPKAPAAAK